MSSELVYAKFEDIERRLLKVLKETPKCAFEFRKGKGRTGREKVLNESFDRRTLRVAACHGRLTGFCDDSWRAAVGASRKLQSSPKKERQIIRSS